jgi:hypothetical protein
MHCNKNPRHYLFTYFEFLTKIRPLAILFELFIPNMLIRLLTDEDIGLSKITT